MRARLGTHTNGNASLAAAVAAALVAVSAAASAHAGAGGRAATGTLDLRAELRLASQLGECLPGVTASACAARTGDGLVPGLGRVSEAYTFLADTEVPPCAGGFGKALAYPVRFVVAGKGEIDFRLAKADQCVDLEAVRTQTQAFTITGGTGMYANASGSGIVERVLGEDTGSGRVGRETWSGALVVPGLEFDVTAPALSGAHARTVRAPRGAKAVRVRFAVTARDDVDGPLPVVCRPRSGSRFKLGKTRVTCTTADTSGNTSTARFTVVVRPRR